MNKLTAYIRKHSEIFSALFYESAVLMLGLTFVITNYMVNILSRASAAYVMLACVTFLLTIFLAMCTIKLKTACGETYIDRFSAAFILAVNSSLLPDMVMDAYFFKPDILYNILGLVLCCIPYIVVSVIFRNPVIIKIFYGIISGFFTVYAAAQYYITEFRGNPIAFSDFANLKSAAEIKGEYRITPHFMTVYALLNFAFIMLFIIKCKIKPAENKTRLKASAGIIILCLVLYAGGNSAFASGIKNRQIILNFSGDENYSTYCRVGFNLMFYFDCLYNRVSVPDNYSDKKAEEIISAYSEKNLQTEKKPVIIGIMNESFADFQHIGEFRTNKDYIPNYHKLQEESVSGYVTVSAYGGYSCNSEYEFLTGNTMGFLPSGSAVFTQYLENQQDSLASYLKGIGYNTVALSPCDEDLWNIGKAYENLRFDERIYNCTDDISNPEFVNGQLSDKSLFEYIEKQYEKRKGSPLFMWTATMQNHGPYDKETKEGTVEETIEVTDYDSYEVRQYLNTIYQSDKAIGQLIDYFRNVDDEVIIVMFGDHYPHIMDFSEYLYGKDVSSLNVEDYSRLHQTPFFIWSNKGIKQKKIDKISLNYLSDEVMKAAGLPLAPYQQKLEKIRETLPVISGFGFMNKENKWFYLSDDDKVSEKEMNEYNIMQYYRMFAKK